MLKFSQLIKQAYIRNLLKVKKSIDDQQQKQISNKRPRKLIEIRPNKKQKMDISINKNKNVIDLTEAYDEQREPLDNRIDPCSLRQWELTEYGKVYENDSGKTIKGQPITLMSYNILAQNLLNMHPRLYINHDKRALNWKTRRALLIEEILTIRPTILCLQELQESHVDEMKNDLSTLNFKYIYKKRTGDDKSDGCAIFYNTEIFNLVHYQPVEYYQPNIELLSRDNVAIIGKFSLKTNPSVKVIISTTHLLYNPKRQDVRLAQIQILLAELDRLAYIGTSNNGVKNFLPIILTGDFNLQPFSAPYSFLTGGYLNYSNLTYRRLELLTEKYNQKTGEFLLPPQLGITDNCQHYKLSSNKEYRFASGELRHSLNLTSVYRHNPHKNDNHEITTYQNQWITVDYILYNKYFNFNYNKLCEGYLKLLSRYKLPTVNDGDKLKTIPSLSLGSDHLSLTAKFLLTIPKNSTRLPTTSTTTTRTAKLQPKSTK